MSDSDVLVNVNQVDSDISQTITSVSEDIAVSVTPTTSDILVSVTADGATEDITITETVDSVALAVTSTSGDVGLSVTESVDNIQIGVLPFSTTVEKRNSFRTVERNLEAYNVDYTYDGNGNIDTATYDLGSGQSIVKTYAYDVDLDIETVTLSGDTPFGIDLVRTILYDGIKNIIGERYT